MNHQEAAYDHRHGMTAAEERLAEAAIDDRAADIADAILTDPDQFEELLYELLACRYKTLPAIVTELELHRHKLASEALDCLVHGHPTHFKRIMFQEAMQEGRRRAEVEHQDGLLPT